MKITEARSRNHCAVDRQCVCLKPTRNRRAHYCIATAVCTALPHLSTIFHKRYDLRESVIEQKMCFDFPRKFRPKYFSLHEKFSEMLSHPSAGVHARHRWCCRVLMKITFFIYFRRKYSNVKLHENSSREIPVFPC
jgi:hypothetical protein